MTTMFILQII